MATGSRGDYEVGYCKPPRGAGFKKRRSGNPRGRPPGSKNLTTLLNDPLNEQVTITEARAPSSANPTPAVAPADEEVLAQLKARLEAAIRHSIAARDSE